MTTAASDPQIVPRPSASMQALRAADQGVADALQSVLSNNTRRVYAAQWRIFTGWCDEVGLVAALSDAGLRRSEAAALTWGAVVAITPVAMKALDALRPVACWW